MNGDGKMDKKEFSIAMHLIKKKLQGYELPKVLPASLKADPKPMMGTFAQPAPMGFPMQGRSFEILGNCVGYGKARALFGRHICHHMYIIYMQSCHIFFTLDL